jgi:hypothetical protein
MTRPLFFCLFLSNALLSTLSSEANAQTLVAPSFLSGDSFTMGVTGIVSAGEPGEDMNWDYSGIVTQDSYGINILPSSPSAYEDDYPEANWIMEVPAASQSIYCNLGPDFFEFFGGVEQGLSYPLTDSDRLWSYPFEYEETWNDSMSGTLNAQGMIINRSGTTESTNNGFGSVSMPGGVQLDDVTRVEMTREITDSSFTGVNIYVVHQIRFHQGTMVAPLVVHTNFQIISELDTTVTNSTEVLQAYTVGLTSIAPPKEEFGMFPNPARDDVQVVWSSYGASSKMVEVRDITGRVVEEIRSVSGMSSTTIDVSAWASGVYTVTVNPGQNNPTTKKLIVE